MLVRGRTSCGGGPTTLTVAAAPDVAATVARLAAGAAVRCASVQVLGEAPGSVAAALAAGVPPAGGSLPDVWIPDTALWLGVARATRAGQASTPATGTSLASSPEVIAVPRAVATGLGWPTGAFGWGSVLGAPATGRPLTFGMPDPGRSGPGLVALYALDALADGQPAARTSLAASLHALAANVSPSVQDLLDTLPQNEATSATSGGIAAFPATEQAVWRYNRARPAEPLVAGYPVEGAPALDYPYLPAVKLSAVKRRAAAALGAYLTGDAARLAFAQDGFRSAAGKAGPQITLGLGLNPATPPAISFRPRDSVRTTLDAWQTLSLSTRLLGLLDVSGSMATVVPGSGQSRLALTVAAAEQGLQLFSGTSAAGIWSFTSTAAGSPEHHVLASIETLNADDSGESHRQVIANALDDLTDEPGRRNGLYETLLAGYEEVKRGWDPRRVNALVVFTDGKDADLNRMPLAQLLSALAQDADPAKHIQVVVIAVGDDANPRELRQIAQATGGLSYVVKDPAQIRSVFLDAIAHRG